ncbi:MAG TPA: hypothetical protein DCZ94_18620 [Lentisphaeria bacterium]|nr:MAG: hypothetical protein A2X48_24180 [Lentisphaerae bacterium GWF2_49_21]HBC88961.1 hypothetical protein [Lentisphaeria bacterium]
MKRKILIVLVCLCLFQMLSFSADEANKAAAVDMKALALRFDTEAKPFLTGDKKTTFTKIDGGFEYAQPYSIVPVLDGIMKVNNSFCNKATTELVDSDKAIADVEKLYETAAGDLKNAKEKCDDTRENIKSLESELQAMEIRYETLKNNTIKTPNLQQMALDIGKRKNVISDTKRDLKKFEKDLEKKRGIPEQAKKRVATLKSLIDAFKAGQKKLVEQKTGKPEEKKPEQKPGQPAPLFK